MAGRTPTISKPLKTSPQFFDKYAEGITARQIELLTGWSRATVRRRMREGEFPPPTGRSGNQNAYDTYAVLEWLSRFNLKVILGDEFLEYERTLKDRAFADPRLTQPRWRIIDRENLRRAHVRDGIYAEMPFMPI